jgi:hypothetical protein
MTRYKELLETLAAGGVEFIVIGGVAGWAHGSPRATQDVDVVYRRSEPNISRLVETMAPLHPELRGAPKGLPFAFDAKAVKRGLNFTLVTDLGAIDVLGEIAGGGDYDALMPHTELLEVLGVSCRVLDLDTLIKVKRAAGRPKDFEAIAELEALREERGKL